MELATTNKNKKTTLTWEELLGLAKCFGAIRRSNPKVTAKVDYWLTKNEKATRSAWEQYLSEEMELIKKNAPTLEYNGQTYLVFKGKDENDMLYNLDGFYFKKVAKEDGGFILEPSENVQNPSWELEEKAEGDEQPVKKQMPYQQYFETEEQQTVFREKLTALQSEFRAEIDLWKISIENMDGVSVEWNERYADIADYRNLLYDLTVTD